MFRHILIPTDGSSLSSAAVEKALRFAQEAGAQATLLTVIEPFHVFSLAPDQVSSSSVEFHQHAAAQADRILSVAEAQCKTLGVQCASVSVEHDQPHEVIVAAALQRNCDLTALASRGRRGLSVAVLGSQTMKVPDFSKIPVLMYRWPLLVSWRAQHPDDHGRSPLHRPSVAAPDGMSRRDQEDV